MRGCSVTRELGILRGGYEDYERLGCYHYRGGALGPYCAIFAMRALRSLAAKAGATIGVIVYKTASPSIELRRAALGDFLCGLSGRCQMEILNKNIRCISRVIIEPRFRGLGLASRLVRETMGEMDVPIIEAMAIMGRVNPFFERAGMKAYEAAVPVRQAQLVEAFSAVGIEESDLLDATRVERKLKGLASGERGFIEGQIRNFLKAHDRKRQMGAGLPRTRYILSRLTERPVYYIWINKNRELITD